MLSWECLFSNGPFSLIQRATINANNTGITPNRKGSPLNRPLWGDEKNKREWNVMIEHIILHLNE